MTGVRELAGMLKELEKDLGRCNRCGMCQAVCPLYVETQLEADVARGKIVLVENLGKEILDNPKAVKQRLDRCLLCGSCAAACPAGVPVLEVFLKARAIITGYLGLSPLKKAFLRGFFSSPERFDFLLNSMARVQGPFSKSANKSTGSLCSGLMSPLIGDRNFVPIVREAWHKKNSRGFEKTAQSSGIRVVFYPGCLVDRILPQVADAALSALDFHGVDVFVPSRVPCCGIPALGAGDRLSFETLVARNTDILAGLDYDFLVTPCATCASTIRKIWPSVSGNLPDATSQKLFEISAKTREISEFLVDIIGVKPLQRVEDYKTVTYHDPCHLKKSLGIEKQPRMLIEAAAGCDIVEMKEPDRCCGMGGSFNIEHYELSKRIGRKKMHSIAETGADMVATGCPACMLQITDLLSGAGYAVDVCHAVEVYAQSLARAGSDEKRLGDQVIGDV
ncbi:MAG: (Fe-S)-binding protein [Thermodesulfobacteriota bacterium]